MAEEVHPTAPKRSVFYFPKKPNTQNPSQCANKSPPSNSHLRENVSDLILSDDK